MPVIVLPLPPNSLRVNERMGVNWAVYQADKHAYMLLCAKAAREQRAAWENVPASRPLHLKATVYLGYRQRCDSSDAGSWIKSGIDALVAEGVWPDDNASRINPFTADVQRDRDNPRVELTWDAAPTPADELAAALAAGSRMVRVSRRKA